jgi:VIT1/CCC1 family predicted Fe2+/Mn2+ transporter
MPPAASQIPLSPAHRSSHSGANGSVAVSARDSHQESVAVLFRRCRPAGTPKDPAASAEYSPLARRTGKDAVASADPSSPPLAARISLHVEPRGVRSILQHYLKDIVYGANDGLVTTFAVVAGVEGGALSQRAVLIVGLANLLADGLSMAVGNYLSIRSNESVRRTLMLPEEEARPARHALATFMAFATAGAVPLLPYLLSGLTAASRPFAATVATFATLFGIGALRASVTEDRWLTSGLEMLALGAAVAVVAYYAGALVGAVTHGVL